MRHALLVLALVAVSACSEPRKEVRVSEALPTIPMPPASHVVGREIGEEAVKVQFRSALNPDQVALYYRDLFSKPPWRLVSDLKTADGALTLYAETDGPPIWITIRRTTGGEGSMVDLAGAKTR